MYHNIPYSFYPSYYSPTDGYAQALAEERAARDQYVNALQQQQEARDRAARARLARQAYHSPYNSYLSSSDDDGDFVTGSSSRMPFSDPYYEPGLRSSGGFGAYGMSPQQQRRTLFEDQRRKELLELQKARERERVMELVEEERRKQLMEEELRRRIREEERQRRVREEEELRRKILEEERANVEQERLRQRRLSELEQLYRDLGFRPTTHSQPAEQPFRRARTMSPPHRHPSPQTQPTPVRISTPEPRSTSTSESERAASPKPEPRSYTPEQVSAALKIQSFYRSHFPRFKSLKTLSSLQSHFESLRSSFTLPTEVDFKLDASISNNNILTVPTHLLPLSSPVSLDDEELPTIPSLAYTPTNAPLHQYYEELNRLLTKLDAIESQGDRLIRDRRRELARTVEREAERVDRWKVAVWKAREGSSVDEPAAAPEEKMIVDDTSALPPVVDAVCESSISLDLESQTSPRPLSLAEVVSLPVEAEMISSSSEPRNIPSNAPEELTSQPNVDTPNSPPPFPSSNILPNPDLHTSVPECVDVSEEPSSTTVPTPIPMASDISDEFVTINLTTPEGDHVPLEVPKDDDGLSDSETVVHSPVLSPKSGLEGSVLKPKEDSLLPLFDRDWRIFEEFVMI